MSDQELPARNYRRMRYRVEDTPDGRRVVPLEPIDLTPEQQAAMVEFGKRLVQGMRKLADAFNQLAAAAVKANDQVEAARAAWEAETEWPDQPHTPREPEPTLPTAVGSSVLVRSIGGNPIALRLRPDTRGRIGWLHAEGNPWVEPIVRDHLIKVLFDAAETNPPEPEDAPT